MPSDKPTSVYAALLKMRQETWDRMAREVFDSDPIVSTLVCA
ncbi:MAG: hypothetical protein R3C02_18870 [Planctomycetaceae bacterium]